MSTVEFDDLFHHVWWPLFEALVRVLPSRILRQVCRRWRVTHDEVFVTNLVVVGPPIDPSGSWCARRFPRLQRMRWTSSEGGGTLAPVDGGERVVSLRLKHLHLDGPGGAVWITDENVRNLASWAPALVVLRITHAPKISDSGVGALCALTALEELGLRYCDAVTVEGLRSLRSLRCLRTLDLTGCWRVRDGDLTGTASFPHLRRLTCDAPIRVHHLDHLTALDFSSCTMSPVAVSRLRACLQPLRRSHLRELRMPDLETPDLDAVCSEIARFSALTCLDFACNAVHDHDLGEVARAFPKLAELRADYAPGVTCVGMSSLRALTHLARLELRGCPSIADEGLGHLAACTALTSLRMQNIGAFTDTGLRRLANLRGLVEFGLYGGGSAVTDAVVLHWSSVWTRLTSLDLSCAFHVSDAIFEGLVPRRLRVLHLYGCYAITDRGLHAYDDEGWEHVTDLNLSWCRVTDRGLRRVLNRCASLTALDVYGCPGVTPEGVRSALAGLPQRVRVHVHAR